MSARLHPELACALKVFALGYACLVLIWLIIDGPALIVAKGF